MAAGLLLGLSAVAVLVGACAQHGGRGDPCLPPIHHMDRCGFRCARPPRG
jgi:hypothetical protein